MRRQLMVLGLLALLLGGVSLGALVAWAYKVPELQTAQLPPPPSARTMSRAESWLWLVRDMEPYKPPPPMRLSIPRREARDEIVRQVQDICRMLKPGKLKADEVAKRLGTVFEEYPGDLRFHPRSPYFNFGMVGRNTGEYGGVEGAVEFVDLRLTDPRLLLDTEAVAALGPDTGRNHDIIDSWEPHPLLLAWGGQPKRGAPCEFFVRRDWGTHYYGMEENPVRSIGIEAVPDDE